MGITFHEFADKQVLAAALAEQVASLLGNNGILAVSGGSTPVPFFAALKPQLEKREVTITLADERWVPPTHPDSNELLVRQHLLANRNHFVSLKSPAEHAATGVPAIESRLMGLAPLSATVLGMGEDGHTASLFPNHPTLKEGLDPNGHHRCLAVTDAPKPPPERITLTYSYMRRSSAFFLHITGQAKRALLEEVIKPGPLETYPIRAFLQQTDVPVAVYWAP